MSTPGQPVLRFAPSPNGALHLGHALSALTGWAWAQRLGGRFLVRIEDIDPERSSEAHVEGIFRDLAWLGVSWDASGEEPVLRQSQHLDRYEAAAAQLARLGLLYPCFASRREIAEANASQGAPRDPDGAPLYPGDAKSLPAGERARLIASGAPFALRLDMAAACRRIDGLTWKELGEGPDGEHGAVAARPEAWGDVILARKETPTSYHLSVVIDDAIQGVSEIVRGQDLFHATAVHRLLQILLGLPDPAYRHHRLIRDEAGRKLSKSSRSTGLRELRAAGITPADVRRLVGLG